MSARDDAPNSDTSDDPAAQSDEDLGNPTAKDTALERIELGAFLNALFEHSGLDYRGYAAGSLLRRIKRRMALENYPTISVMQGQVLRDPQLLSRLVRDMSIHVTAMFRDPSFFVALRQRVLPLLKTYPTFRIWHAGCASGEEVFSLAIMLHEAGVYHRARIYATDVSETVLDQARQRIMPIEKMREYTTNYLRAGGERAFSEYYVARYDGARLREDLAKNIVFAQHNLATDGVFSECNLVVCRNVMIYFAQELQNRALGLFSGSLVDLGFLAIGRKESLRFSTVAGSFAAVDDTEKIYRKIASGGPP
jgi:chemotaxis protein methyltransferase CheR